MTSKSVFFGAAIALLASAPAFAADMAFKALPPIAPVSCTQQGCSGAYAGFSIAGNGTGSQVTNAGVSQSIFAGGEIIGGQVGYQLWNGTYLFAAEVSVAAQLNSGPLNQFSTNSLIVEEGFKFGGALSGLIGGTTTPTPTASTTPGQAPAALPTFTSLSASLISPYIWLGAVQRAGNNQLTTGVGAEYVLAQSWNLDVRAEYAPALDNLSAFTEVKIGLNYHFKP